jgi:sugar/nucleoside kinase (ribokinase family)
VQINPSSGNTPRSLFIGRSTLDVLYSLDSLPPEDTKAFAREMHAAPGGPALNAAITHALLGGKTTLMSAVGGGPWAGPVRSELGRRGIAVIDLAEGTSYEVPLTTVLVNTATSTRTCVNPPRSNVALTQIESWDPGWGEMPRLILADGFHLGETLTLLTACRGAGAELCLDGGSWKAGTEELASLLTVAICSERFAVPGRQANPDSTIDWFATKGISHVAITRGAESILGWDRGRRFEIEIEKVEVADTLGAGDVLHGAFCYHYALTKEFEESLRKASAIATQKCRGLGIRCWAAGT